MGRKIKRRGKAGNPVSREKAKEIMRHGEVHGEPLSEAQKGMFGAIAGGQKLTRLKRKIKIRRKTSA